MTKIKERDKQASDNTLVRNTEALLSAALISLDLPPKIRRSVVDAAELLHPRIAELNDRAWHGGFFALCDRETGIPFLIKGFGEMPHSARATLSLGFVSEKHARLALHPDHDSSAQSRNPDKDEWGGAIRFREYKLSFSFSGMPERLDEAFCLGVCVMMHYITPEDARLIGAHWKNSLVDSGARNRPSKPRFRHWLLIATPSSDAFAQLSGGVIFVNE